MYTEIANITKFENKTYFALYHEKLGFGEKNIQQQYSM